MAAMSSRRPTPEMCAKVAPALGRTPEPDELLAMLQEEMTKPEGGNFGLDPAAQISIEPTTVGGTVIIPLKGVIRPGLSLMSILFGGGSGSLSLFRASLREAANDPEVGSILIDVDSPGGLIDLVPETAAEIRAVDKPIKAVANTESASAAYWLASQADEFAVTPSGQVGSIGVYMLHTDWSAYNEALGVNPTYISAGKFKTDGNPDEPLSDSAREAFQAQVDTYYGMFVSDVAVGRGTSDSAVRSDYGEGRMFLAQQAEAQGMVDEVASIEQVLAGMSSSPVPAGSARARVDKPTISFSGTAAAKAATGTTEVEEEENKIAEPEGAELTPEQRGELFERRLSVI